jgi:acylphosphatase
VLYTGQVQGVGFRYTARRIASRYPVTGYVRNLPDGQVQLVVEGAAGQLGEMLGELADSMRVYIDGCDTTVLQATGEFSRFEVRY